MFLTLNPSDFWQFPLLIGLIIDNHNNIVSNLDRFVFSEYPNRYPNWVPHLGTQRFQLTPIFPSRVMVLRLSKKVHFLQSVPTSARNLSISQPVFVGLQHLFSVTIFRRARRLQDVLQMPLEDVLNASCKTSWKMKNCCAEDVLKTSRRHVLKMSWRQTKCLPGISVSNYGLLTNLNQYLTNLYLKSIFHESKANPKCIN